MTSDDTHFSADELLDHAQALLRAIRRVSGVDPTLQSNFDTVTGLYTQHRARREAGEALRQGKQVITEHGAMNPESEGDWLTIDWSRFKPSTPPMDCTLDAMHYGMAGWASPGIHTRGSEPVTRAELDAERQDIRRELAYLLTEHNVRLYADGEWQFTRACRVTREACERLQQGEDARGPQEHGA